MKLRIKKEVLGEGYLFYLTVRPKTTQCEVRLAGRNESIGGIISLEKRKVELLTPIELRGYIDGLAVNAKTKMIKELHLSKHNYFSVKEYLNQ